MTFHVDHAKRVILKPLVKGRGQRLCSRCGEPHDRIDYYCGHCRALYMVGYRRSKRRLAAVGS